MVRRGAAATAAAAREEAESSPAQRLVDAALNGDVAAVEACLLAAAACDDADADVPAVSRVGVARLRVRCADVALREEAGGEVVVETRELRTDVSPLFAAAHAGHADVARALLVFDRSIPEFPSFPRADLLTFQQLASHFHGFDRQIEHCHTVEISFPCVNELPVPLV